MTRIKDLPPAGTPDEPDLAALPRRVDLAEGAKLVSLYFFKASSRTLEDWPIEWRVINGRRHCELVTLFGYARGILAAAPSPRLGGRRLKSAAGQSAAAA